MERFKKTTIQREIMMKEFCRDALICVSKQKCVWRRRTWKHMAMRYIRRRMHKETHAMRLYNNGVNGDL